jgi:formamidopyrimidine-DNA glycosylase
MPELPEVETSCRGIRPHLQGKRFTGAVVRQPKLRWPVPANLNVLLSGQPIQQLERRAKYLLLAVPTGHLIMHLGMSGSLRVVDCQEPAGFHDHIDLLLDSGKALRLRDPRRFGAVLWTDQPLEQHKLLRHLGPEPLSEDFDGENLYRRSRGRKAAVKTFLMDQRIVVGVGNIYANEALFAAGIRPDRAAGRISRARYDALAAAVKAILAAAIEQGGTTLRDFVDGSGKPGYFRQQLTVYGREGQSCISCHRPLISSRLGQRATVFCKYCQR